MPDTTVDPKFKVPVTTGAPTALYLPYLKFDPTGQVVNASGVVLDPSDSHDAPKLRVLLFQGTASGAGKEVTTRRNAGTTGANVKFAFDEITLKPLTGRAHYTIDPVYNLTASN